MFVVVKELEQRLLPGFEEFENNLTTPERDSPQGYIKISPSALEYCEENAPSESVSLDEVKGSIFGYIGHHIDNIVVDKIREARTQNNTSELSMLDREVRARIMDWKEDHLFFKKNRRGKRAPQEEGEIYSARMVQNIWNSHESFNFEESVLKAHQKRINKYLMNKSEGSIPLLLETEPTYEVLIEEPAMYNIDLGFAKLQVAMRYDYLIHDRELDRVMIVDTKFGSRFGYHENLETQAFLYCILARHHLKARELDNRKVRKINSLRVDTHNVEFYYRVLERGKNEFHYFPTDISKGVSAELTEEFFEKLATYQENYQEIKRIKEARKRQFVMPYIPTKKEDVPKQPRLIYASD